MMNIAVIGNAADLISQPQCGKLIDSCDKVIRINSFRLAGVSKYVGTRVDIVSLCFARYVVGNALAHSIPEISQAELIWTPYARGYHSQQMCEKAMKLLKKPIESIVFADELIDKSTISKWFYDYIKNIDRKDTERQFYRPTTGLLTILLVRELFPAAKIYLAGFGLRLDNPTRQRFDTSGVKMWEYHDLHYERQVLIDGIDQRYWVQL